VAIRLAVISRTILELPPNVLRKYLDRDIGGLKLVLW
jgi:hypothetical protein